MKKRITKLTKLFLVICLVVSELSSVGFVFAEDMSTKFDSIINVSSENKYEPTLTISSNDLYEVKEDSRYIINYQEKYTYLDNTSKIIIENTVNDEDLAEKLNSEEGYLLTLEGVEGIADKFNGVYSVVLKLYEGETLVDETTLNLEYNSSSRLETSIVMEREGTKTTLEETDGVITIPKDIQTTDELTLYSKLTTNELAPTKTYQVNGKEYTGNQLVETNFAKDGENDITLDYLNKLGGYYEYTTSISLEGLQEEQIEYTDTVKVLYQDYEYNDDILNIIAERQGIELLFESNNSEEGYVYTKILTDEDKLTVSDIRNYLNNALTDEMSYTLSNIDETEVVDTDTVLNNLVITIQSTSYGYDNIVKYRFKVFGDVNDDNIFDEEDLQTWIDDNYYEDTEDTALDMDNDGEITLEDLAKALESIKQKKWEIEEPELGDATKIIEAKLTTESETITTGDEFTVSYLIRVGEIPLSSFEGKIVYDETVLELVSVESKMVNEETEDSDYWIGRINDNQFVYLTNLENAYQEGEYEVLRFTFLAKGQTENTVISLEDTKYLIGSIEFDESTLESLEIAINASNNNKLKSLLVGDNEIELIDEEYEYEIDVENDVETIDVEAVAENIAALISMDIPEKLEEGSNVIKITVLAENGETQDYFITVNRKKEEIPQENIVPVTNNTYEEPSTEEEIILDEPTVEPKDDEDKKDNKTETSNISKYIIIFLIIAVIIGLGYLIFKEDDNKTPEKETSKSKDKK